MILTTHYCIGVGFELVSRDLLSLPKRVASMLHKHCSSRTYHSSLVVLADVLRSAA